MYAVVFSVGDIYVAATIQCYPLGEFELRFEGSLASPFVPLSETVTFLYPVISSICYEDATVVTYSNTLWEIEFSCAVAFSAERSNDIAL